MKMTRILYGSDFHGSDIVFRKFIGSALQYKANVLIVGGDVTGKAMIPVIHQGDVFTVDHHLALIRRIQTSDDVHQGRLSAATFTSDG